MAEKTGSDSEDMSLYIKNNKNPWYAGEHICFLNKAAGRRINRATEINIWCSKQVFFFVRNLKLVTFYNYLRYKSAFGPLVLLVTNLTGSD